MPKKVEIEIYTFDELSDEAKDVARNWWREGNAEDTSWSESVIADFVAIAGFCGWDITKQVIAMDGSIVRKPRVYWSGFSSQGDGACFEGTFNVSEVNAENLKNHAPHDAELARLADGFAKLAAEHPTLGADVAHSGHYCHEMSTSFSVSISDEEEAGVFAENQLKELSRGLMRWLYRALEGEWGYQNSAEVVDENICANGYEFTANGKIY